MTHSPTHHVYIQHVRPASNGMATAALVLGIVAVATAWIPVVNFVLALVPLLAVIFGVLGAVKARRVSIGFGPAIAGLILGGIAALVDVTVLVSIVAAAQSLTSSR